MKTFPAIHAHSFMQLRFEANNTLMGNQATMWLDIGCQISCTVQERFQLMEHSGMVFNVL